MEDRNVKKHSENSSPKNESDVETAKILQGSMEDISNSNRFGISSLGVNEPPSSEEPKIMLPSANSLIASTQKMTNDVNISQEGGVNYLMNNGNQPIHFNNAIQMNHSSVPYYTPQTTIRPIYGTYYGNPDPVSVGNNTLGQPLISTLLDKNHLAVNKLDRVSVESGTISDILQAKSFASHEISEGASLAIPPKKRRGNYVNPTMPLLPQLRTNHTYNNHRSGNTNGMTISPSDSGEDFDPLTSSRKKRKYFRRNIQVEDVTFSRDEIIQLFGKVPHNKGMLNSHATRLLRDWFCDNLSSPYPTREQKEYLVRNSGLSESQVSNWFTNQRKRIWKPYVEDQRKKNRRRLEAASKSGIRKTRKSRKKYSKKKVVLSSKESKKLEQNIKRNGKSSSRRKK